MPTTENYAATQAPDRPLDVSGPCKGFEDLADETLSRALSDIEEFAPELNARGADVSALTKAVRDLICDIANWRDA